MPTIAIIAPSGYAPDPINVSRAIQRLEGLGWTIKNFVDPNTKYQRFSADDATRLAQIYRAAEDPDVDLVMALRGGYGLSRILNEIDFKRLANTQKKFVGFSDFTAFQLAMLAKTGVVTFSGPMICGDFGAEEISEYTFQHFQHCLMPSARSAGLTYGFDVATEGNPDRQLQGMFWGGNLSMVTHLVGTQFMPQIEGGVLFVEDVNENPYRIERMLLQLHHAGILARQKALVLGHFTNYSPSSYDNGYDFSTMLSFIRSKLPIPVLNGLPFGHCPRKVTLPVGADVEINSNARGLSFQFRMAEVK